MLKAKLISTIIDYQQGGIKKKDNILLLLLYFLLIWVPFYWS